MSTQVQVDGPWTLHGQPLDATHLKSLPQQNVFAGFRYVYVAEFATGWVKVGHTADPRNRLQCHARGKVAIAPSGSMQRCWVSRPTRSHRSVEKRLIALGAASCSDRHRNEYFNGCSFDALVAAGVEFVELMGPTPAWLVQVPA